LKLLIDLREKMQNNQSKDKTQRLSSLKPENRLIEYPKDTNTTLPRKLFQSKYQ